MSYKRTIGDRVNSSLMLIGIMTMIGGILVFGYQSIVWLLWGYWSPYSTREFWYNSHLPVFDIDWYIVDRIVAWISGYPFYAVAFLFGLGLFLLGVIAADRKLGPNL